MTARAIPTDGQFDFIKAAGPSENAALARLQTVANLLDSAFVMPGTKQRVGIDALIGLIPGLGDVATTLLSSYIVWEARNLGVSKLALMRMLANLAIHATVGSMPLVGDIFDAFFRVNQRNMRILRAELGRRPARAVVA